MYCANCGTAIPDGSAKCTNCGHAVSEFDVKGALSNIAQASAVKGLSILVLSYFMMPIRTLKLTARQLRELGAKGALEVESTNVPHLTWLTVTGNVFASVTVIVISLLGIIRGLAGLGEFGYDPGNAVFWLIASPILGFILAALADWLIMFSVEILLLLVGVANDIHQIRTKG